MAGKTQQTARLRSMAIIFPYLPVVGDLYPENPGEGGVTQYRWDGEKWNAVAPFVSLGYENQYAYNTYQWPRTIGESGDQLTVDDLGRLAWLPAAVPTFTALTLLEPFDDVSVSFTLVNVATGQPFTPFPVENIIVFVGGVPQTPGDAYTVSGSTITFTEAPLVGTNFYALCATNIQ